MDKKLHSKNPIFQTFSDERKLATLKVDAFNLTRLYLLGSIKYEALIQNLEQFSASGILSVDQLKSYCKPISIHEAYMCSIGKSGKEKREIRKG